MISSRVSAGWRCIWRTKVSRGMDRLAESARFPRQDVPQGTLYAPAQNRRNRPPPNGLQGPRSSRAGWSVRSWPAASATPAAGWWASAFVLRFQPRPQDLYTVFRLTPRSLEISAALTSLSRSSWLAQGRVTADLALAWSTAVTVPCTLTTASVSTERRSSATRAPAVRPPESSGLADGEAGPLLGDLGDLIGVADGVRVWRRSHLGPDAAGVSPPGPRAAGLRRRIPPRPCGAGNPPGRPVLPQLCVRGRWGRRCSPERWGASFTVLPRGKLGGPGVSRRWPGTVPGWASSGRE